MPLNRVRTHLLAALATLAGVAQAQTHVYVDKNTEASNPDGTSWETAFPNLSMTVCSYDINVEDDVIIHVAEGVYDIQSGEMFPIVMRDGVRIWGENAFTVVIDGGSVEPAGFVFNTDPHRERHVVDPCSGLEVEVPGTFSPSDSDGTYLANLTIRNFHHGIELYAPYFTPGGQSQSYRTAPTFANLVLRGNRDASPSGRGAAIYMEIASPGIYDCTLYDNDVGIDKHVEDIEPPIGTDCSLIDVRNCIVWGNTYDLINVSKDEIQYSDFSQQKAIAEQQGDMCPGYEQPESELWVPSGAFSPGSGAPSAAKRFNVDRDPGFIANNLWQVSGFDLRLDAPEIYDPSGSETYPTAGVRNIGLDTTSLHMDVVDEEGVPTDGEGRGNPRVLPYSQPANPLEDPITVLNELVTDVSMGADQYDLLCLFPLMEYDHPNDLGGKVVGLANGDLFWMRVDGMPNRVVNARWAVSEQAYPGNGWLAAPFSTSYPGLGTWLVTGMYSLTAFGDVRISPPPLGEESIPFYTFLGPYPARWSVQGVLTTPGGPPITEYEFTNAQDYIVD